MNMGEYVPSVSMPEMSMASVSMPSVTMPEMSMSLPDMPSVSIPEMSMPSVSMPEMSMPSYEMNMSMPEMNMGEYVPSLPAVPGNSATSFVQPIPLIIPFHVFFLLIFPHYYCCYCHCHCYLLLQSSLCLYRRLHCLTCPRSLCRK